MDVGHQGAVDNFDVAGLQSAQPGGDAGLLLPGLESAEQLALLADFAFKRLVKDAVPVHPGNLGPLDVEASAQAVNPVLGRFELRLGRFDGLVDLALQLGAGRVHLGLDGLEIGIVGTQGPAFLGIIALQADQGRAQALDGRIVDLLGQGVNPQAAHLAVVGFGVDQGHLGLSIGRVHLVEFGQDAVVLVAQGDEFLLGAVFLELGLLLGQVVPNVGDALSQEIRSLAVGFGTRFDGEVDIFLGHGVGDIGGQARIG